MPGNGAKAAAGGAAGSWLVLAAPAALLLLAAALAWPVPMMLWDHLDLVPVYEAWQRDGLAAAGVAEVHHGSHLHLVAYLLLLGTTWLSGGQPWLDGLASWLLLLVYAALLLRAMPQALPEARPRWLVPALVGFVFHPGHLANLQWGWQVAVFSCLAGMAVALAALARPRPGWAGNLAALAGAALAIGSFSTGLAIIPVAVLLLALQQGVGYGRRLAMIAPWLLLAGAAVAAAASSGATLQRADAGTLLLYVLGYLGGAVARLASDLAPWLAAAALASAVASGWIVRRDPRVRLWAALSGVALGAAILTALGRAGTFGVEHALVTRYVSFSSLFWLGWLGLVALALPQLPRPGRRIVGSLLTLVLACAVLNALHMVKKAREVAQRAGETALAIRSQYPDVDEAILGDIYFGRVDEARERLEVLHRRGFAPFRPE